MPSLKIVLHHREGTDKVRSILFRLTINRETKYKSSSYAVRADQFKAGLSNWVSKHPDAKLINRNLEIERARIMANLMDAQAGKLPLNHKVVFEGKIYKTGLKLSDILQKKADYFEKSENKRWFYKILSIRREAIESMGDVYLSEITIEGIKNFELDLKKKNNANTIAGKMKVIRNLITTEIKAGNYYGPNLFEQIHFKKIAVKKDRLTREEMTKIENLQLTGTPALVRDMFLFSFYMHGMRFENCLLFKKKDAKKLISYRMNKGKKTREIAVHPKLQAVINRNLDNDGIFLFPFVKKEPTNKWTWEGEKDSLNMIINRTLKNIAFKAKIMKNVTFHIARHSFASILKKYQRDRGITDIFIIQDALGHSDIKTTQMYLDSLDDDEINEQVNPIFD